jgi:hypothetical protein
MRKFIVMMAIAALFTACSNSAESDEDAAKKKADSIHTADSIANAMKMEQDKMMNENMDKMKRDSLDKVKKDSLDKMQKK